MKLTDLVRYILGLLIKINPMYRDCPAPSTSR